MDLHTDNNDFNDEDELNTEADTEGKSDLSEQIIDYDSKQEIGKFEELGKFYEDFASKMLAFDPLDRPIYNADKVDQMIKRDQLVEILDNMTPISGYVLNAPMSNDKYDNLISKFESAEKECREIADQYL